jgi:hypothetical protein
MATDEELKIDSERLVRQGVAALTKKLDNQTPSCPICKTQGWNAEVAGFLVSSLPSTGIRFPPPFFPTLVMTCEKCGFVAHHNLKTLQVEGPFSLHSAQGVGTGMTRDDVAKPK